MELKYNVTGADRKRLVNLIAAITGCDAKYLGAPTFAYEVDCFTIDKNGNITFDDRADSEEIEQIIERLYEAGFTAENAEPDENHICISMPKSLFTDTVLENLKSLVIAKGALIRKAICATELPIRIEEDKVCFPWFKSDADPAEVKAYEAFICKLCEMARNQKRANATEMPTDNEKYAFRCFLLRLGFIGAEYKETRKILLRNLTGSSAFKSGQRSEVESCE